MRIRVLQRYLLKIGNLQTFRNFQASGDRYLSAKYFETVSQRIWFSNEWNRFLPEIQFRTVQLLTWNLHLKSSKTLTMNSSLTYGEGMDKLQGAFFHCIKRIGKLRGGPCEMSLKEMMFTVDVVDEADIVAIGTLIGKMARWDVWKQAMRGVEVELLVSIGMSLLVGRLREGCNSQLQQNTFSKPQNFWTFTQNELNLFSEFLFFW